MTDLYQRHGGDPAPLPSIAFDERNFAYTPPYAADDLAMLGFSLAPVQPEFDSATQRVEWKDGAWAVVDLPPPPPEPEPEPEPVFVYKLDLFERTTNAEAEAILEAMDAQHARVRMIFNAAQSFREDHELWPLLTSAATEMFGAERAGELLAPSRLEAQA